MENNSKRRRVDNGPDYMSLMEKLQELAEKNQICEKEYLDFSTILKEHRESQESSQNFAVIELSISAPRLIARQIRQLRAAARRELEERDDRNV
jgi:hypothetical protein